MGEHYARVPGTRELIGPYETVEELGADMREALEEFVRGLAEEWHGGQASGLYAILSAGIERQDGGTLLAASRELEEAASVHVGPSHPEERTRLHVAADYLGRLGDARLELEGC